MKYETELPIDGNTQLSTIIQFQLRNTELSHLFKKKKKVRATTGMKIQNREDGWNGREKGITEECIECINLESIDDFKRNNGGLEPTLVYFQFNDSLSIIPWPARCRIRIANYRLTGIGVD